MRTSWLLSIAAAASLAFTGCGMATIQTRAAAPAAVQQVRGEVVFTRALTKSAAPSLYLASAGGTGVRLFLRDAAEAAVSPDGRRIAFVRAGAIWIARRDGSGQRLLTRRSARDETPAWSADGHSIYFARRYSLFSWAIFSVRDDGAWHRVSRGPGGECEGGQIDPAPSPSGGAVVYTEWCYYEGDDAQLAAMSVEGRRVRLGFRLTQRADYFGEPAWAPDGRALAYVALDTEAVMEGRTGGSGLYISSAGGSLARRVVPGDVGSPSWSADGSRVSFARAGDIWLVSANGSGLHRLTSGRDIDSDPAWLPALG